MVGGSVAEPMWWLDVGEAENKTNLASLAGAGLSLAI